ncbi:hypothetical protein ONZ45_g15286 [Pleurotus djamor]|nr:hypothetical protein ONZ45_g15286 [Pleurotus djamor]
MSNSTVNASSKLPAYKPVGTAGWKSTYWSVHCAKQTRFLHKQATQHLGRPKYEMPKVYLDAFIEDLIYHTPVPRSASLAALSIMTWITESGSCPRASSSAHHLFAATYLALLLEMFESTDRAIVKKQYEIAASRSMSICQLTAARIEVSLFIDTLPAGKLAFLQAMLRCDGVIDNMIEAERTVPVK